MNTETRSTGKLPMQNLRTLAFALTALYFCGCGTLNNTIVGTPPAPPAEYTPPLEIYGGIKSDFHNAWNLLSIPDSLSIVENSNRVLSAALSLADVPFSLVGDTVTLGQTIPASYEKSEGDQ